MGYRIHTSSTETTFAATAAELEEEFGYYLDDDAEREDPALHAVIADHGNQELWVVGSNPDAVTRLAHQLLSVAATMRQAALEAATDGGTAAANAGSAS